MDADAAAPYSSPLIEQSVPIRHALAARTCPPPTRITARRMQTARGPTMRALRAQARGGGRCCCGRCCCCSAAAANVIMSQALDTPRSVVAAKASFCTCFLDFVSVFGRIPSASIHHFVFPLSVLCGDTCPLHVAVPSSSLPGPYTLCRLVQNLPGVTWNHHPSSKKPGHLPPPEEDVGSSGGGGGGRSDRRASLSSPRRRGRTSCTLTR